MRHAVVTVLLCMIVGAPASADVARVLSWDKSSVTVEFVTGDPLIDPLEREGTSRVSRIRIPGFPLFEETGRPVLPAKRFLFEVTAQDGVRLQVIEREVQPLEGVIPTVYGVGSPADQKRVLLESVDSIGREFIRLSDVGSFRGRSIAFVDFFPVIFDGEKLQHAGRIVVRLSFPPSREDTGGVSFPHEHLIVNKEQAARWRSRRVVSGVYQRTPFEFARSRSWLKLKITNQGIYLITYNDLTTAGVNPLDIDPSTLRLFSSDPRMEPDLLSAGGSFEENYHLVEHACLYRGRDAGEFLPGDSILFYGVGVEGWVNDIDPSGDSTAYYKHRYETSNAYWLTWSFPGSPKRMDERGVSPSGAPGAINVTAYTRRLRLEDDKRYNPVYTDDGWYWMRVVGKLNNQFDDRFTVSDLVASSEALLRTIGYGSYSKTQSYEKTATYYINGARVDTLTWTAWGGYHPEYMELLERKVTNLVNGPNTFTSVLNHKLDDDEMFILWYEIHYRRRLRALYGKLDFHAPLTVNAALFTMTGFSEGPVFLFDVTDFDSPVHLTGLEPDAGSIIFEDDLDGAPRHYIASDESGILTPVIEVARSFPADTLRSLRDEAPCPDMMIIYHDEFRDAALTLKNYHAGNLPGVRNPIVDMVDIADVYNNFSGGRKDPVAIRNYLKFLYENYRVGAEPVLQYVLLIGNGNYDPKNYLHKTPHEDFIPLYMSIRSGENEAMEDEDFLVKMDVDVGGNFDRIPDFAIGRMTVLDSRQANSWAQRIIQYADGGESGAWRNRVILTADDEHSSAPFIDFSFLNDAEAMSSRLGPFPSFVDYKKIYSHHYPYPLGSRNEVASDKLIEAWSEGALIFNYAGHGAPPLMADEQLMLKADLFDLQNDNKRPLYLSFSCSIGDFEDPDQRSMSQDMVTMDNGGAISSISGASPTYGTPNSALNMEMFRSTFTSKDSTGVEPMGFALIYAKMLLPSYFRNNAKYVLFGDPAVRLAMPKYIVHHDISEIDTMYTGRHYRVEGYLGIGGGVNVSFNGKADVIVQEAEERIDKVVVYKDFRYPVRYSLPGKELYRGTVDVTAGRFSFEFVTPVRCRTGPGARVRSYVWGSDVDGIGANDTLLIFQSDDIPGNDGGPDIHLYFTNQATKVKRGAVLIAEISDPDGIAILETKPQNSIFLEFDGSGIPIFVTKNFNYGENSYTGGMVEYELGDHDDDQTDEIPGKHTVIIKAFDNLGAASSDTLEFEVVQEGRYSVSDVFNFPNPFTESTNFVFQLSSAAAIEFSIFNLSGIKIWDARLFGAEGFNSIYWDGRDYGGDVIANGTYIYVIEADFEDSYNQKETVTGKAVILR